jgi:hypothetical protein
MPVEQYPIYYGKPLTLAANLDPGQRQGWEKYSVDHRPEAELDDHDSDVHENCPIRIYEGMRYPAQPLLCRWDSLAILIRPSIGAESSSRLCRCFIRTRTDSYKLYWLFRSSEVSPFCSHVLVLHLCRTLLCTKSIMNSSQMIAIRSGPGIYSRAPYPTRIRS